MAGIDMRTANERLTSTKYFGSFLLSIGPFSVSETTRFL